MRIKVQRTTKPKPGETLGFERETLFAHIEMDVENVQLLIGLKPEQLVPLHLSEEEDRRWMIKDPLLFHTVVTSLARRGSYRHQNAQLAELLDLMKDHLAFNDWELQWDTLQDMVLEIQQDSQEVRL